MRLAGKGDETMSERAAGDDIVGIAGMREGGVGKREDGAAMGDGKPVQMPVLKHHLDDGIGRTGIYDVTITASDGGVIAEFRGMSRKLRDPVIPDSG